MVRLSLKGVVKIMVIKLSAKEKQKLELSLLKYYYKKEN